jgi:RNA polymerase sigma-70 factor, ECF subfamily
MSPASFDDVLAQSAWLRRFARRLCTDPHGAEDLVQQTFVVVLRHPHRPKEHLRPWLASVVRSLAYTERRARSRRLDREARVARPEAVACVLDGVDQDLLDALNALAEPYRSTVVQRYLEDEPTVVIARRTGRPAARVRDHLARGISKLRLRMGSARTS